MFAELPQAPVIDSAQVGRTPPIEPDPCSITHHDHLPASSLLPPRAQDESVAGMLELAASSQLLVPLVAVSDDGPSSETSSESGRDLNDSPRSPRPSHRHRIADDEPPAVTLGRIGAEQAEEITWLYERVKALHSQIANGDEKISTLVDQNVALVQQKQTLEYSVSDLRRRSDVKLHLAHSKCENLGRLLAAKDREIIKLQHQLKKNVDQYTDRLAVGVRQIAALERRSAEIESESKRIGAQLEQLPEVKAEFAGIPSGGVRFTPRVVHHPGAYFMTARPEPEDEPPFAFGQIADVD